LFDQGSRDLEHYSLELNELTILFGCCFEPSELTISFGCCFELNEPKELIVQHTNLNSHQPN
jgi:hypothetical protein